MAEPRRFRTGDRLIVADHNEVKFGRVIDRSGSEYRTLFPEGGDRDNAHWCDDEDSMRFVHVDDSAVARAIDALETRAVAAEQERDAARRGESFHKQMAREAIAQRDTLRRLCERFLPPLGKVELRAAAVIEQPEPAVQGPQNSRQNSAPTESWDQ